ncbi:MAG: hypothetical protein WCH74_12525 [Chloroflexota bacterium]
MVPQHALQLLGREPASESPLRVLFGTCDEHLPEALFRRARRSWRHAERREQQGSKRLSSSCQQGHVWPPAPNASTVTGIFSAAS